VSIANAAAVVLRKQKDHQMTAH